MIKEILAEKYLYFGGFRKDELLRLRQNPLNSVYITEQHLSIGSIGPFNETYIQALKAFVTELNPTALVVKLHFSYLNGIYLFQSEPLIFSFHTIDFLIPKLKQLKKELNVPILIENISHQRNDLSHFIPEYDFLNLLCGSSHVGLALNLEALEQNSFLYGYPLKLYLEKINRENVKLVIGYREPEERDWLIDRFSKVPWLHRSEPLHVKPYPI